MIDLHIHSTYSDGTYNPIELLQKAEKLGLEIISITDHESIDAHIELSNVNIEEYYKGKVITGIEFVEEFINEYDIDGLECYHSLFSTEGTEKLLEICDKYNVYKSGGSDYHGIYKPYIELGTGKENNLNISKDLVAEWINKIN